MLWFRTLNQKKLERCKAESITEEMHDQFREMGDESPLFR
jgi:hypothetical protein